MIAVNDKKKGKTEGELPANCFYCKGKCCCHQSHRIIESHEKDAIGDIHAMIFTTSTPCHQSRLQSSLWQWLESIIYSRGVPPPSWTKRNRLIATRTFSRREECVRSSTEDPDSTALSPVVETFIKFWNFDWTLQTPGHICEGCCKDANEARDNMYSSALGVDLLMGRDSLKPSMDDWGSAQEGAGMCTAGIMVHNVLQQLFQAVFVRWGQMLPDADAPGDINHLRAMVQKKCWRSKCVLNDNPKRQRIMFLAFIGPPVEEMMSTLQYRSNAFSGYRHCRRPPTSRIQGPRSNIYWL